MDALEYPAEVAHSDLAAEHPDGMHCWQWASASSPSATAPAAFRGPDDMLWQGELETTQLSAVEDFEAHMRAQLATMTASGMGVRPAAVNRKQRRLKWRRRGRGGPAQHMAVADGRAALEQGRVFTFRRQVPNGNMVQAADQELATRLRAAAAGFAAAAMPEEGVPKVVAALQARHATAVQISSMLDAGERAVSSCFMPLSLVLVAHDCAAELDLPSLSLNSQPARSAVEGIAALGTLCFTWAQETVLMQQTGGNQSSIALRWFSQLMLLLCEHVAVRYSAHESLMAVRVTLEWSLHEQVLSAATGILQVLHPLLAMAAGRAGGASALHQDNQAADGAAASLQGKHGPASRPAAEEYRSHGDEDHAPSALRQIAHASPRLRQRCVALLRALSLGA